MKKTFLLVIALFFGLAVSVQASLINWDQFCRGFRHNLCR
jgi:hypothetical protein